MIVPLIALGLFVLVVLTSVRLAMGPTLQDRALAAKALIVQAALLCAAFAAAADLPGLVDVSLVLVLGALVLLLAVVKIFRLRTFQAPLAARDDA